MYLGISIVLDEPNNLDEPGAQQVVSGIKSLHVETNVGIFNFSCLIIDFLIRDQKPIENSYKIVKHFN